MAPIEAREEDLMEDLETSEEGMESEKEVAVQLLGPQLGHGDGRVELAAGGLLRKVHGGGERDGCVCRRNDRGVTAAGVMVMSAWAERTAPFRKLYEPWKPLPPRSTVPGRASWTR